MLNAEVKGCEQSFAHKMSLQTPELHIIIFMQTSTVDKRDSNNWQRFDHFGNKRRMASGVI